ncbi:MAG: GTP cyclohydrolase I [Sphaerochaetaceae bacterium]|jgi:GTP cyclohydrolase I
MKQANNHEQQYIDSAMRLKQRDISPQQVETFESYMKEIFEAFGMDTNTESTIQTPKRFIQALYEATEGYDGDSNISTSFDSECRDASGCTLSQIIQGPIPFHALCEHHVLPFYGNIYVGYIAKDTIIGISKLTRLVRLFSKRFAVQERIGQDIADMLETMVAPEGIAVYIEARHMCMEMRGVKEDQAITRTTVWRGSYRSDPALRTEFFTLSGLQRHG